ncbi:hypothetical protein SAMN04488041_103142 [Sulfitobacter pontiacus]|uniref:Uncharacterized protein n=1 Tax=Sulfitobacter pontiacus TaxID=60137 RepID=A0A1H2W3S1_9RHOB|nr:hypothetical protein [Sulfitobacter pontiacus]SDW75155.1 hypothetical protein SAMN04488041_103142 [Sulfitobacter pontiacus]
MSRISATEAATSREPQGRQPLWDEMVKFKGAPFTITDIFDQTYINRHTIRSYLKSLALAKYVERIEPEEGAIREDAAIKFRIIADPVPYHAPRLNRDGKPVSQGGGVENMWRTMRMIGQFTPRDIAAHATTDIVSVTDNTAKAYCTKLLKAGFLKVVSKAQPPAKQAVYRLIRNTGPQPPMIQRTQQVFDPNTRKAYPVGGQS